MRARDRDHRVDLRVQVLRQTRRDGENAEEGILIRERPTQQDLAAMIGTSRETVSRALSELQRRDWRIRYSRICSPKTPARVRR